MITVRKALDGTSIQYHMTIINQLNDQNVYVATLYIRYTVTSPHCILYQFFSVAVQWKLITKTALMDQ
jgi:hypothetical protein